MQKYTNIASRGEAFKPSINLTILAQTFRLRALARARDKRPTIDREKKETLYTLCAGACVARRAFVPKGLQRARGTRQRRGICRAEREAINPLILRRSSRAGGCTRATLRCTCIYTYIYIPTVRRKFERDPLIAAAIHRFIGDDAGRSFYRLFFFFIFGYVACRQQ